MAVEDVVLDDVLLLSSGNQICADATVVDGECEVNESLITGESDPVVKQKGDSLLSGSFVVSGSCAAQVDHVGADNYAQKIAGDARVHQEAELGDHGLHRLYREDHRLRHSAHRRAAVLEAVLRPPRHLPELGGEHRRRHGGHDPRGPWCSSSAWPSR